MPETLYTPEEDQYIIKNVGKLAFSAMGAHLGKTRNQIRGRWLWIKEKGLNDEAAGSADEAVPEEKLEITTKGGTQTITSVDANIQTLPQLLTHCNVDLSVWEVASHTIVSYQSFAKTRSFKHGKKEWRKQLTRVQLFRIKATLQKISSDVLAIDKLRKAIIAEMDAHAPKFYTPIPRKAHDADNTCVVEINLSDHHFAKLCWAPETGASYDLKIAERMWMNAILDFADQIRGMPIEYILLPVGNDIFHTDTITNTTTGGTPQDVDDRWMKMFMVGKRCLVQSIDLLRQIAPVKVVIVPGNHDRQRCFYLGDTLQSWYHDAPEVTIDNSPAKRKFVEFGVTLIGYTHCDTEKPADLPMQMAITQKAAFARTSHWEWHVGHTHTRKQTIFKPLEVHEGVHVRVFPTLCPPDSWHFDHCYNLGPRASDAMIWRKKTGYGGILTHNPTL